MHQHMGCTAPPTARQFVQQWPQPAARPSAAGYAVGLRCCCAGCGLSNHETLQGCAPQQLGMRRSTHGPQHSGAMRAPVPPRSQSIM